MPPSLLVRADTQADDPTVAAATRGPADPVMDRRGFAWALGLGLLVPQVANAQASKKLPRIGFLWTGSPHLAPHAVDAFRQGLRDAGYVEGQTIVIEHRWAADVLQQLPDLAAELVRSNVDIIVTQGTPAAQAAKRATSTIPIVMSIVGDPVGVGLIASLARPGGNITGSTVTVFGDGLNAKRLELLREVVPTATRVAVIVDPTAPGPGGAPRGLNEAKAAARSLGLQPQILEVRAPADFEKAFEAATKARAEALTVLASPILRFHRKPLVNLAAKHRLPAMYQSREFVEDGGLMAYGPRDADLFRRAAGYVDKILKGAKPAELPVEQPTRFEFVINLKTAKALGLKIPPSVLGRADHVIE